MKSKAIFSVLIFSSLIFCSAVEAALQPYVAARVCDWHVFTDIAVVEHDDQGNAYLKHSYPNLYPPDPAAWMTFIKRVALAAAVGGPMLLAASVWAFGVGKTVKGLTAGLLAAMASSAIFKIRAVIDEYPEFPDLSQEHCRFIKRDVTNEKARNALAYVEEERKNPGYNIFYSTCEDFSQNIFAAAGQDFDLVKEAHELKPLNTEYLASNWMKGKMLTRQLLNMLPRLR